MCIQRIFEKKINIVYLMHFNFKYFSIEYSMLPSVLPTLIISICIFDCKFLGPSEFSSPIVFGRALVHESIRFFILLNTIFLFNTVGSSEQTVFEWISSFSSVQIYGFRQTNRFMIKMRRHWLDTMRSIYIAYVSYECSHIVYTSFTWAIMDIYVF